MSYGAYIAVYGGVGGTIHCSVTGFRTWYNMSNIPQGFTGFTGSATFTVTPSSGYKFLYFRIGTCTTSETYTGPTSGYISGEYASPLSLASNYVSSGHSYCVYAVFEKELGFSVKDCGDWSDSINGTSVSIGSYEILRYKYTPTRYGTVTFYSSSFNIDTIGWISDRSTCEVDIDGYPSYYIGDCDEQADGNAFSATADVEAHATYYLYVCCYQGDSNRATLHVSFAANGYFVTDMGTWTTSTNARSATINSYEVLRYSYTPAISGVLTFWSSTGSIDTIGWINDSADSSVTESGYPSNDSYYIGNEEDLKDDANGRAFSAAAPVTAGTTYYLFVCCYSGSNGRVTLNVKARPFDWSWVTTVSQGSAINLTAAEWNSFTSRINEFRKYSGLSEYSFTTAVSGSTKIEASICNQAYTAIEAILYHGTLPTKLVSGGLLYASFFNGLKDALNAIP